MPRSKNPEDIGTLPEAFPALQITASLLHDLIGRSARVLLGWHARPEAVHFSLTRRDMDNLMMALRIGFPSHNGSRRDKDVDPQPFNEMEAYSLRAVHVIPGDLHLVRPCAVPGLL